MRVLNTIIREAGNGKYLQIVFISFLEVRKCFTCLLFFTCADTDFKSKMTIISANDVDIGRRFRVAVNQSNLNDQLIVILKINLLRSGAP